MGHETWPSDVPKFEHAAVIQSRVEQYKLLNLLSPEKRQDAHDVLQLVAEINRQMAENLQVWESKTSPGVAETYTTVSARDLLLTLRPDLKSSIPEVDHPKKRVFLFSCMPNSVYTNDGSFTTAADIGYGLLLKQMLKVKNHLADGYDFEVVLLGSPLTPGGKVSEGWVKSLEDSPFATQGILQAELVTDLSQNSSGKIEFTGQSYGAIIAANTAQHLPSELKERTIVLADNPDPVHGEKAKKKGGFARLITGLVTADLPDLVGRWQHYLQSKKPTQRDVLALLEEKAIDPNISGDQADLKKQARTAIFNGTKAGPVTADNPLYATDVETIVRQGAFDVSSQNIFDNIRRYFQNKREVRRTGNATLFPYTDSLNDNTVKIFPFRGTHAMDRSFELHKWINIVHRAKQD